MIIFLYISAISVFWGAFGRGTGPTFLNGVVCNGTESSLLSCSHREIGTTVCSHSQDVGVVCPPGKSCIGEGSPYHLSGLSDAKMGGTMAHEVDNRVTSETSSLDHCWLLLFNIAYTGCCLYIYTKLHLCIFLR